MAQPSCPPSENQTSVDPRFLQRLLLHQLLGGEYMADSDEDSTTGE